MVDFLERYDCLIKYSNQGFENSHQIRRLAWKRATNGGDGKKHVSPILQLLLWQFVELETTLYLGLPWDDINFKKKFSCGRLYELEDSDYSDDTNYDTQHRQE
jgi:hypothetical protein